MNDKLQLLKYDELNNAVYNNLSISKSRDNLSNIISTPYDDKDDSKQLSQWFASNLKQDVEIQNDNEKLLKMRNTINVPVLLGILILVIDLWYLVEIYIRCFILHYGIESNVLSVFFNLIGIDILFMILCSLSLYLIYHYSAKTKNMAHCAVLVTLIVSIFGECYKFSNEVGIFYYLPKLIKN